MKTTVTISVEWGYEMHSLTMNYDQWASIQAGEEKYIGGEGFHYEGEFFYDGWTFNTPTAGNLLVTYDDGGVGYEGSIPTPIIDWPEIGEGLRIGGRSFHLDQVF